MEKDGIISKSNVSVLDDLSDLAKTNNEYLLRLGFFGDDEREESINKMLLHVRQFIRESVHSTEKGTRKELSIFVRAPHSDEDSPRAHKEGF